MKTFLKVGVTVAIAGAIVWSIPPARKFVKDKAAEFSTAFRDAESTIINQLLTDPPLAEAAAPAGVQQDDDWF